ncbi:Spastin [Erysiphe neolycopersici]|uniref:Spastin n=1 Tax=Erysiphe neolycopersici TaxID=212602 RepID=A0A420HG27_9PEZI|nr:Spastin [Erysiphe neolycopersici]
MAMEVSLEKQKMSFGYEKKKTMKHTLRSSDNKKIEPLRSGSKGDNLLTSKAASIAWKSKGKLSNDEFCIKNQAVGDGNSGLRSHSIKNYDKILQSKDEKPHHTLANTYTQIPIFHNSSAQKVPLVNIDKFHDMKHSNSSSFKNRKCSKLYASQSLQDHDASVIIHTESSQSRSKRTPFLLPRCNPSPLPRSLAKSKSVEDISKLVGDKTTVSAATLSNIGSLYEIKSESEATSSKSRNNVKTHAPKSTSRRSGYQNRKKNSTEVVITHESHILQARKSSQILGNNPISSENKNWLVKEQRYMQKTNSSIRRLENKTSEESSALTTQSPDSTIDVKINQLKLLPLGVDEEIARQILNEIVIEGDQVNLDDVVGLDNAKSALKEAVVYPFLRPDLFMGLREPARGILLFGPPGTGKTMLAKAIATESKSTFFSISASSLISKYLGESERLVKALFKVAKALAPSIIFVDEIDSLLSSRTGSGEHESTRRVKTEFLIQWSDLQRVASERNPDEKLNYQKDVNRVLVLAATNLPWAIDEAARRRFVRRQYIPLPEGKTRAAQFRKLLNHQKHELDGTEIQKLVYLTEGFSSSDITALTKDAAMGPLRSLGEAILIAPIENIRPIRFVDFESSLASIRPSVSPEGLQAFEDWANKFGERGN